MAYVNGKKDLNLILHCGAQATEIDSNLLHKEPTPMGRRHSPMPHIELIEYIKNSAERNGLNIVQEAFGATESGARAFGIFEVDTDSSEYSTTLGFRASIDMSLGFAVTTGPMITVCDNLCITGDYIIKGRATTNIRSRIKESLDDAMQNIHSDIHNDKSRFVKYKSRPMNESQLFEGAARLYMAGGIGATQIKKLVNEYKDPTFEEFAESENVWRFYNAATQLYKPEQDGDTNLITLPERGQALSQVCDYLAA